MTRRYAFVDAVKAIGIVLVVLGHAPSMPAAARTLIFGAHVPLFFFASGFLASGGDAAAAARMRRVPRRLLLPYACFFGLSFAYWLSTRSWGNSAAAHDSLAWWAPLPDFIGGHVSYVNPTLWFFPCLAVVICAHAAARRLLQGFPLLLTCAALAAVASVEWSPDAARLPWQLDAAAIALAFYALGQVCRERELFGLHELPARRLLPWLAILAGVYCVLALQNPGVDLANMRFGSQPELYLPVALIGIAATVLAGLCLPPHPALRWLSEHTLYIFPLHWLMFRVFTGVGIVVLGLPRDFKDHTGLVGLAYAALALALYPLLAAVGARVRALRPGTATGLPRAVEGAKK